VATTGEGEASGGGVATAGGGNDGNDGDDSGRPARERGKRKKRESKDARRRHAAKGR
jgi:hypothetical protein